MIDLKEQAGLAMNVRGQFSDPIADPKVTLGALAFANELGRLLWRMKYGQDFRLRDSEGRTAIHRATLLLANCIRSGGKFSRGKFTGLTQSARRDRNAGRKFERETADLIEKLALRAIMEWIDDRCPRCDGRGVIGRALADVVARTPCTACGGTRFVCVDEYRIPFAARPDGKGPIVYRDMERCGACSGAGHVGVADGSRRAGRQICPDCQGNGSRVADHASRARAIGVSMRRYNSHWHSQFDVVFSLLDAVDANAHDTVRRLVQR
ncbi:hypothetical protein [Paraburkholderia bryophila]|uniref:Ribosomal protein S27AE n=1 Tax=Paraburkholderia bryophila TaxID=420952 RepID=A0A7Y9W4B1_9BURK|nr:hypothetical protein [Paraburkholderia bryophila]NYH13441.1 ribosomal protein S27AE [Paraburkholderia bryophila]